MVAGPCRALRTERCDSGIWRAENDPHAPRPYLQRLGRGDNARRPPCRLGFNGLEFDGQTVAGRGIGFRGHSAAALDLESGKEIATFTGDGSILGCTLGADNRTIVASDSFGHIHFLRLVEADSTKPVIGDTKIQFLLHKEQAS
jgi:hypothetical protein